MGASGSSYTQANRLLSIDTPLGTDALLLQGLTGGEGISRMFSYDLDLLAYGNDSITFNDIVGQNVTITIQLADGTPRYINGYVSRFAQGATDDRYFTHYTAQVVPWLWFLTRQADCRIFQNLAVPDIITQVFGLFSRLPKFQNKLTGTYPTLEYCVQYRETSFNFVSRLMEENGIFYYFDHTTQGQHTMVLADAPTAFVNCPDVSTASYEYRRRRGQSGCRLVLAHRTGAPDRQVHVNGLQFHHALNQPACRFAHGCGSRCEQES